jgi:20S proteasome alpha/beta subunit
MTIAIGFKCSGGVVLCADSLESNGPTKRMVSKLWCYQVAEEWGIAIASAGDGDLSDSFTEQLGESLGNSDYDESRLMEKLRVSVRQLRIDYPYDDFNMLVGIFSNAFPHTQKLYRVFGNHFGPIVSYQCIGVGSSVADFICSQIHTPLLSVRESERLGILTVARVKDIVEGCGGPTRVASFQLGQTDWRITPSTEILEIESEFSEAGFREHMQAYWVAKNPVSDWPGGYRWLPPPGVRWKKSAKLNTMQLEIQKPGDQQ